MIELKIAGKGANTGYAAKRAARLRFGQRSLDFLYLDPVNLRNLCDLHPVPQPSADLGDVRCRNFAGRGASLLSRVAGSMAPLLRVTGRALRETGGVVVLGASETRLSAALRVGATGASAVRGLGANSASAA